MRGKSRAADRAGEEEEESGSRAPHPGERRLATEAWGAEERGAMVDQIVDLIGLRDAKV